MRTTCPKLLPENRKWNPTLCWPVCRARESTLTAANTTGRRNGPTGRQLCLGTGPARAHSSKPAAVGLLLGARLVDRLLQQRGRMSAYVVAEHRLVNILFIFHVLYKGPPQVVAVQDMCSVPLRRARAARRTGPCTSRISVHNVMI